MLDSGSRLALRSLPGPGNITDLAKNNSPPHLCSILQTERLDWRCFADRDGFRDQILEIVIDRFYFASSFAFWRVLHLLRDAARIVGRQVNGDAVVDVEPLGMMAH